MTDLLVKAQDQILLVGTQSLLALWWVHPAWLKKIAFFGPSCWATAVHRAYLLASLYAPGV